MSEITTTPTVAGGQSAPQQQPSQETSQSQGQQSQAPRFFAGKYDSPEALEQAYLNAQTKLGELSAKAKPAKGEQSSGGFDAAPIEQMILSSGTVTPEARKTLNEAGFSDRFIDSVTTMYQQGFETWKQTAQESLTNPLDEVVKHINTKYADKPDLLRAYQTMLSEGEIDFLKKYDEEIAAQKKEQPQHGSIPKAYGGEGYASKAEFGRDTMDPRFATDANFRKMVEAKRARSNF